MPASFFVFEEMKRKARARGRSAAIAVSNERVILAAVSAEVDAAALQAALEEHERTSSAARAECAERARWLPRKAAGALLRECGQHGG